MTQPPPDAGLDPQQQYLEQILRSNRTAWELFRYGYEAGLAKSVDHERLARIIRAQELNYADNKSFMKSTRDFIDVLAYRAKKHPRRENG